jgi:quercetin 2,3-dioxygenase
MESPIISIQQIGFQWKTKDPFLFCAHHTDAYPKGNEIMGPSTSLKGHSMGNDFNEQLDWRMYHGRQIPGFPVHPHRGFETITIVLKGYIDHTDSAGGAGRYGDGDVQWMTAGMGLQHSEMFPLVKQDQPNPLELFQIWLNLPKSKKMVKPYFKMLWKEEVPTVKVFDEHGKVIEVTVITGSIHDIKMPSPAIDSWAYDPANEVAVVRIKMDPGANYNLNPASNGVNRMVFFYKGRSINIEGEELQVNHSADIKPELRVKIENSNEESEFLLLQGKPINEPVVQYGPFVMNTQHEIHETVSEYRRTEFGGWPWPEEEYVHGNKPRFAKYSDGKVEYPDNMSQ